MRKIIKVLISGPSGIACGLGNRLDIISNISSLSKAHEELGDDVERRPIIPGENLDKYARIYLVQQTIASWSAPYALGFLYAISARPDSIICFDDWQAPEAFKLDKFGKVDGLINCAWNPKLTRQYRDEAKSVENLINEGISTLCCKNERKYLLPVFIGGNYNNIACNGIRLPYSPYPYMRQYKYTDNYGRTYIKHARWVMASLQDNSRWINNIRPTWPILYYGVKKLGQQRLSEAQLARIYASSWGVMSPPHPKLMGSGWFRVRVPMALEAGSLVLAPSEDAKVLFGDNYYLNSNRIHTIEESSEEHLKEVIAYQRERFTHAVWSKETFLQFIEGLDK